MVNKQLIVIVLYNFLLIVTCTLILTGKDQKLQNIPFIPVKGITRLSINGKPLPGEFINNLSLISESRIMSREKQYFNRFGLDDDTADIVSIAYQNGFHLDIFTGDTKENLKKMYIRLSDSEIVYEISGDFLDIVREKDDDTREYSLIKSHFQSSVIALKIISPSQNLYITENTDGSWIDQNSGFELDRIKVRRLISKVHNLLGKKSDSPMETNPDISDFTIEMENLDGSYEKIVFSHTEKDPVDVQNTSGEKYKIEKNKLDFLSIAVEDLQ